MDQHMALEPLQLGKDLGHRVGRALAFLLHDGDGPLPNGLGHRALDVVDHDEGPFGRKGQGVLQGVFDHGLSGDLVQDLGGFGAHPGAVTGGQEDGDKRGGQGEPPWSSNGPS